MEPEKIIDNNVVLAMVVRASTWPKGLNFISAEQDFIQVGFWDYEKGKHLAAHRHLEAPRQIQRTQEVVFIKQGSVKVTVFSEHDKEVAQLTMKAGDVGVFLGGGHAYDILEDNTQVLEVKNGPYVGPEQDRVRI